MKKIFLTLMLLAGTTFLFAFSSEVVNSDDSNTEYRTTITEDGTKVCYARKCTVETGSDGYEYKTCSDWEEVDCNHIIMAK